MEMRRAANASLVMIGNGICIWAKTYLAGQKVPDEIAILLSVILGSCGYAVMYFMVFNQGFRFHAVRKFFDPRAKVEGRWTQELQGLTERNFSVLKIWYDRDSANYRIEGANLAGVPDPEALFSGSIVRSSTEDARVTYYFDAMVSTGEEHVPAQGVGQISFMLMDGGKYNAGFGWLVDNSGVKDAETRIITFRLARAEDGAGIPVSSNGQAVTGEASIIEAEGYRPPKSLPAESEPSTEPSK